MESAPGVPSAFVIYSPFDVAYENAMKRQQVMDVNHIKFPLILCHRSSGFSISNMTHRVLGTKVPVYFVDYFDDNHLRTSRYIQVINVDIPYSIEILTKDEDQAFAFAQELIFLLIREPFVEVPQYDALANVPVLNKTKFIFNIILDNEIADNTDLEAEAETGKLYRLTLSIVIQDAAITRDVEAHLVTNSTVYVYTPENEDDILLAEINT